MRTINLSISFPARTSGVAIGEALRRYAQQLGEFTERDVDAGRAPARVEHLLPHPRPAIVVDRVEGDVGLAAALATLYPGLVDGETEVNGAELVEYLSARLGWGGRWVGGSTGAGGVFVCVPEGE